MATQTDVDEERLLYPDSDGKPMADNTLQFLWIVTLQGNLAVMFRDLQDVFVAGDLLWYAVQGKPRECLAPDAMVVFGRPKGHRGSYRQWREGGIAPQVAFEVLSPNNTPEEMERKLAFYDRHGVEEYYLYDPDGVELFGWLRIGGHLQPIESMHGWVSPRLEIRFDLSGSELVIYKPNDERFLTFEELAEHQEAATLQAEVERRNREKAERQAKRERQQREKAERKAEEERKQREEANRKAEVERKQSEKERLRAERLAAKLRELGVDPDA